MLLSNASTYAIRAALYLAQRSGDEPVPLQRVATDLGIPRPIFAKVVRRLVRGGMLSSRKGPGGGIALGSSAGRMTLLEIVTAVEGHDLSRECIIGVPGCSEEGLHCPLHASWGPVRERVIAMLARRTVAAVAREVAAKKFVLGRPCAEKKT